MMTRSSLSIVMNGYGENAVQRAELAVIPIELLKVE